MLSFKDDLNGSGRLGVLTMDREAAHELELLICDMASFWDGNQYEPALAVCTRAVLSRAPYVHFYDPVTGGAGYIGSKSELIASVTDSAATLCEALVPRARGEADCSMFFTFLHAMTLFRFAKEKLAKQGNRPAWDDTGSMEQYGW